MFANMSYNAFKYTYNSHLLLLKFHAINIYNLVQMNFMK